MLVAEDAAAAFERLSEVGLGLGEASLRLEHVAHIDDRRERVGVLVAEDAATGFERLPRVELGLGEPPLLP